MTAAFGLSPLTAGVTAAVTLVTVTSSGPATITAVFSGTSTLVDSDIEENLKNGKACRSMNHYGDLRFSLNCAA